MFFMWKVDLCISDVFDYVSFISCFNVVFSFYILLLMKTKGRKFH